MQVMSRYDLRMSIAPASFHASEATPLVTARPKRITPPAHWARARTSPVPEMRADISITPSLVVQENTRTPMRAWLFYTLLILGTLMLNMLLFYVTPVGDLFLSPAPTAQYPAAIITPNWLRP